MTKNVAIYHIYRMIERDSDEDHKLTQKEIVERLKSEHDIVLERKAVGRAIDELAQIDDNIRKIPHGGVYMEQRTFESCELFFLLDSVYYNRQLPQKQARDMIDKLISLGLVSFRKQAKKQYISSPASALSLAISTTRGKVLNWRVPSARWREAS